MLFSVLPLATTLLYLGGARAANDWSVPCLTGQCSYDLQNSTASGSLQISGSSNSISDLTTAAGWTILDCNVAQTNQDIRVVCTGNTDDCSHLYSGDAENTIVRLPQNCGAQPFARVAKEWTHENQTLPTQVQAMIQKRGGNSTSTPTVRGIRLDTNFAAIDPAKNGNVTMFIQGSNAAGSSGNFSVTPAVQQRGFFGDIAGDIKSAVDGALKAFSFNVNKSTSHTVDFDKSFTLFDQSVNCPATGKLPDIKGEVKVAVEPKAHAVVGFGVVAAGTIVPPKVTDFGLFASLDGSLNGTLTVDASASTTLDSGKIQILQVGIPGLDFPGILTIGPSFVVSAEGIATIDTDLKLGVDLAYNVDNAKLFFPPGSESSGGDFAPANTDLTLAATPNVAASGSIEAHIIPSLQFGLDALDGLAKATINLDLDTSAKLTLSLQAGAIASTSSNSNSSSSSNNSSNSNSTSSSYNDSSSSSSLKNSGSSSTSSSKNSGGSSTKSSVKGSSTTSSQNSYNKGSNTSSANSSHSTSSSSNGSNSYYSSSNSKNYARTYDNSSNSYDNSSKTNNTSSSTSKSDYNAASTTSTSSSASSTYGASNNSSKSSNSSSYNNSSSSKSYNSSSNSSTSNNSSSNSTSKSVDTSFGGCVDLSVGLAVKAGADGSFLGLFDKSTSVTLFQKNFDLFKKCFGSSSNQKRWPGILPSHPVRRHPRDVLAKRALTCSSSSTSDLTSIINDVISAKNIIAKV